MVITPCQTCGSEVKPEHAVCPGCGTFLKRTTMAASQPVRFGYAFSALLLAGFLTYLMVSWTQGVPPKPESFFGSWVGPDTVDGVKVAPLFDRMVGGYPTIDLHATPAWHQLPRELQQKIVEQTWQHWIDLYDEKHRGEIRLVVIDSAGTEVAGVDQSGPWIKTP